MNQSTKLSTNELAAKYQVSPGAVEELIRALRAGGGQAQFNHPDLGGMGQWAGGNMIMIGDMFNHGLKDRVAKLCQTIAGHLDDFSESGSGRRVGRHPVSVVSYISPYFLPILRLESSARFLPLFAATIYAFAAILENIACRK
jgi:hypothetical protein